MLKMACTKHSPPQEREKLKPESDQNLKPGEQRRKRRKKKRTRYLKTHKHTHKKKHTKIIIMTIFT